MSINVKEGADYPTVKIIQPATDYAFQSVGQPIALQGSGTDPVDGTLLGSALTWVSDIDGPLGIGTSITPTLSGTGCGPLMHHVTLTGKNAAGKAASSIIVVYVGEIC